MRFGNSDDRLTPDWLISGSAQALKKADKTLPWLHGEIKTPPFSAAARLEAGLLLRALQQSAVIGMPHARPMPSIGRRCLELRVVDEGVTWRIMLRIDADALIIA